MGNQLAGIAPSQIFPVETYLSEVQDIEYESSLGSTRFLKVAKCKSWEGPVVVKVFVIHDPSIQLSTHKQLIEDIQVKLSTAANCLQFHSLKVTEKACFMFRQYVKGSLYDRISTRPFLTGVEKRWLAFQLLCALNQAHQQGVCHGDIKLENVMVSSWSWLLLADFATYKPSLLPDNDPADYTYYFDTSRRRICYIAPERFFKALQMDTQLLPTFIEEQGHTRPAMDVFSAGCCLAELFTEGNAPFDLTQLLAYRAGDYYPSKVLDKIDEPRVRALIEHMIQREPENRKSVAEYLEEERGQMFPLYFYSFLWPFLKQFAVTPIMSPDDKIKVIKKSMSDILVALSPEMDSIIDKAEMKDQDEPGKKCEAMIIITSLITSSLRSLHYISSKLDGLELLGIVSQYVPDEIILERILPLTFHLLHDKVPRVRVCALHTLTRCLTLVATVPRSDTNIFPEYILPNLAEIVQDEAVIVRQAYAEDIATIAETAVRFLEYTQLQGMVTSFNYDTELANLQEVIQQKVATMFSDSSNVVKRTLMEKTVTKLCVFFGKQKANDVLLSHMITFLNDKHDRHLRMSFFTSIVGVAAYIGCHSADILKPLLLQGLSDAEESVVVAAIDGMVSLTELGLFPPYMQWDLLSHTAPLLIHPNLWIRQAVVGLAAVVSRTLSLVDVQTTVVSRVQPFLSRPLLQLHREVCILSCLRPPVSREVYDALVRSPDVSHILQILQEAQQEKVPLVQLPTKLSHLDHPTRNLLRRLVGGGLTEDNVHQLLLMREHLTRLQKQKKATEATRSNISLNQQPQMGIINLDSLRKPIPTHHCDLMPEDGTIDLSTLSISQKGMMQSPSMTMNEEWQAMFGTADDRMSPNRTPDNRSVSPTEPDLSTQTPVTVASKVSVGEGKEGFIKCLATCKQELNCLVAMKREEHLECLKKRRVLETLAWDTRLPPPGWKPRGHLIAHLHEHRGAVNRLVAMGDTSIYASCSSDGTVKVWDCNRIERKFSINRSKATYNRQGGVITCLAPCITYGSLASASSNGSIHVIKYDKMSLVNKRELNIDEDGHVVDMHFFDTGSQSVLTYATMYGSIVGWDLRAPGTAWKLENGARQGVITSYALEGTQSWLVAGTSSGHHVCWDLRFMLPISTVVHRKGSIVRRVSIHPTEGSWVVSAINGNNEISMWDMETQSRHMTLWASTKPPLSMTQASSGFEKVSNNCVHAMYVSQGDRGPYVLAGGTDCRLRFWDLREPESSYIVCYAAQDPYLHCPVTYSSRLVDGTEVIEETAGRSRTAPASGEDAPRKGPDQPPPGHKDTIQDVIVMNEPQRLIVTAARDGTIKMWK
ncbi:phosphoinositide 3-kinase regulatory subunit 4 isoform X3 [Palaemon carinicauda]